MKMIEGTLLEFDRSPPEARSLAYHEAGHATAAASLGVRVFFATVRPSYDCIGHVLHAPFAELTVADALLITLAGPAAQRRQFPLLAIFGPDGEGDLDDPIGAFDLKQAQMLLQVLHGSDCTDVCAEELPRWRGRAAKLVDREWTWIARVAEELMLRQQLSGEAIAALQLRSSEFQRFTRKEASYPAP